MLLDNFIHLFLESAPWLLLGLVLAGLLKMFVPLSWMNKQLGGHGIKSVVKAALLGAPLPLCSCGVIPAAVGLRRSGASKAATTSFLVSTPETGVDSVAISYVLLGPFMAIIRPIAAITSAITAGLLVGKDEEKQASKNEQQAEVTSSCCSSKKDEKTVYSFVSAKRESSENLTQVNATSGASCSSSKQKTAETSCCASETLNDDQDSKEDCCSKDVAQGSKKTSVFNRVLKGLHYAGTDLVRDTSIWLLIGLFFAAIVQTYVPADFMAKWGDGLLAMLVVVLISIPMYICATASTPIAAGLLLAGVSPGAVLVFMLAGPASNIATLGVVVQELGKRALFGYLGGVLGVALSFGLLTNQLVEVFGFEVMPQIGEHYELLPHAVTYVTAVILALLMCKALLEKVPLKFSNKSACA